MAEVSPVELADRLYWALGGDDVPAVLALLTPHVEWHYPAADSLPYGGSWTGHAGVERFLDAHDGAEEILEFRSDSTVAQDDRVVVFGLFRGRAKPSGRTWETRFVHAITVDGGRVRRFEAYFDTAAAVAAHLS